MELIKTKNPLELYDRLTDAIGKNFGLEKPVFLWAFLPIFIELYPLLKLRKFSAANPEKLLLLIETELAEMKEESRLTDEEKAQLLAEDEDAPIEEHLFDYSEKTAREIFFLLQFLNASFNEWEEDLLGAAATIFSFQADSEFFSQLVEEIPNLIGEDDEEDYDVDDEDLDFLNQLMRRKDDETEDGDSAEEWDLQTDRLPMADREDPYDLLKRAELGEEMARLARQVGKFPNDNGNGSANPNEAEQLVDDALQNYAWLNQDDEDGEEYEDEDGETILQTDLENYAIDRMVAEYGYGEPQKDQYLQRMLTWLYHEGEPEKPTDYLEMFLSLNNYNAPICDKTVDVDALNGMVHSWATIVPMITGQSLKPEEAALIRQTAARFNLPPEALSDI